VIELHTLGDAVIKVGKREVRPTSPAVFAALLYLAVERGQRVPRTALQELLFPETDERSGAHSLRQLLYKLRQLGASVQAEGDVVWLAPEDVVDDYSAPAPTNGNGTGNGNGYGGTQFLGGYAPRLSTAYDEWLESRRSTVGAALRRGLIKYMLARRDAADWITVERVAQDVLAGDAFNEEATFALAEATALSGSKSEAIRILERYESETGRADLKLPAAVLRRRISERLPDRRRRALDTPFLGRDAEAEAMRQAIVQLRAGQGGTVVISGEPGIGKTRLVEETSALAMLEGVNVHVVRCQPHYTTRPMGVFIEWVPMLMQSRGALGVAPETLEHLALLTSHRDDRANRPTDARDDTTRSGILLAAIRDLVDAVASEAPIMVVVEDAHWADATSLREFCTLLEKRRNASLLVVYTTRVLEPLVAVGAVSDLTQMLRLRPLADKSVLELTQQLLPFVAVRSVTVEVVEWCARSSGGNPLYLQMLCGHFEDTGKAFEVPPGVRSATVRRIEQLPPEARRTLEYCALLGGHATLPALRSLVEASRTSFLRAVRGLEEGGFLRIRSHHAVISHDLLRECAIELLPPLSRQLLHAGVAEYLEAQYEVSKDSALLWDCADHWALSADTDKALRFILQCARHASDIGRASEAVRLLRLGRELAGSPESKLTVLEELAIAGKAGGKWQDVLIATNDACALFGDLGKALPWKWQFRSIEAQWGTTLDGKNAKDLLSKCLNSLDADRVERIQAANMLVRIAHEHLDAELAHTTFQAVISLLDRHSTDIASRSLPLIYHTSFGDPSIAKEVADDILRDIEQFSAPDGLRAARNVSVALCNLGEPERSAEVCAFYFRRASGLDLIQWQYDFASNCSVALATAERFEKASEWFDRAEALRTKAVTFVDYCHLATGVDIAINLADLSLAKSRLDALVALPMSSSERFRTVARASQVRVSQMDPSYNSTESEVSEFSQLFVRARLFGCGDLLALTYCEMIARRGESEKSRAIAQTYLEQQRRDPGRPPSSLVKLAGRGLSHPG
jgi:DNA-binding SARP family transcriptional activator